MLEVCKSFTEDNCKRLYNYIKFGRGVLHYEKATFNNQQLKWMNTVKHLGNYIDTTNNDTIDSSHKRSTIIGNIGLLATTIIYNPIFKEFV